MLVQSRYHRAWWTGLVLAVTVFAWAEHGRADEHRLHGYFNGFYSRNYGPYGMLGQDAAIAGGGLHSNLTGPLINRRLLRYSIAGRYTQGRSIGLAQRVRLFDQGVLLGLIFLPENWLTLGVFGEVNQFRVVDGPLHSIETDALGFGADLGIRPTRNLPSFYNRYGDHRIDTDYLGITRGERIRSYSARSAYNIGKTTTLDVAYDWSLSRFDNDNSFRNQRAYVQSFSRFNTETTLSVLGSGNWMETEADLAVRSKSRVLGLRSFFYQRVDERNDYILTQTTDMARNAGYAATNNSLQGLWNHQYTDFLRLSGGAEFAQSVTSGGIYDLTYDKYREAGVAGFNLRVGDADFELTPSYLGRLGTTQVTGARGGLFYGHSAVLPVAMNALNGLPLSLTGFYSVEGDDSAVPMFQRYRSINFRADTYSARSERGTFLTHVYFDAQRLRNDGKIMEMRNQRDESRFGLTGNTSVRPFYSQFGAGYAFSRVETLDAEFDIHHVSGSWAYAPMAELALLNQINWSRTVYPQGEQSDRTSFRSEATYFARSLEFRGAYRYDIYPASEGTSWGVYFEVRRHFAMGI